MSRVLVVDDEALTRTLVADSVRACGHEAVVEPSGEDALATFRRGRFDLVLTDVTMPGMDGIDLGLALHRWAAGTPVVLFSARDEASVTADCERRGLRPTVFLQKPLTPAQIAGALAPLLPAAAAPQSARVAGLLADDGEVEWLDRAGGSAEDLSALRLLFVATRQKATGELRADSDAGTVTIGVRAGEVVAIDGIAGLFHTLQLPDAPGELIAGIAHAMSRGVPLDACLTAASQGLAQWLSDAYEAPQGDVSWTSNWAPNPGSIPIPGGVSRWYAHILAQRSLTRLEAKWQPRAQTAVERRIPGDTPETTWGLDAVALRVHRLAGEARTVRGLLDEASNGDEPRRVAALRALDLLHSFGLVTLGPERSGQASVTPPPTAPVVDPRVVELREAAQHLKGLKPTEVLGLSDTGAITEQDVAVAFRTTSLRFHPDTFFGAPPEVRSVAERCFSIVNEAHAALREPNALAALNKLREGAPTTAAAPGERDPAAARLAFRKGEAFWRGRDPRSADPHFQQAAALDPKTWPYVFYAIQSGYGAKRLSLTEAIAALDAIILLDPVREAELHAVAATLFRSNNNEAEAQARFKRALKLDPANRDALRDARLIASRGTQASTTPTLAERISGLFKRK